MNSEEFSKYRRRKGIIAGLFIVALGVFWLLRKMGIGMPGWLFEWEMILIIIGLFIGLSSNFRSSSAWILMGIGAFFLIDDFYFIPFRIRELFWPAVVIAIGLIIMIRPKKYRHCSIDQKRHPHWREHYNQRPPSSPEGTDAEMDRANTIDSVSVFNGIKRFVLSKSFKGGETVTVFGGTEINMLQADFDKTITLDCVVVFGGLKLIVPPNWEVQINVSNILAGVEDKRVSAVEVIPEDKVLVLTGIVIFGGIEIVNY